MKTKIKTPKTSETSETIDTTKQQQQQQQQVIYCKCGDLLLKKEQSMHICDKNNLRDYFWYFDR